MLGEPILAFDDFVYGTTPVYSSSYLDGALAELESYSIQAMVDSFSENALTVQLETSADGRNWIAKNPAFRSFNGLASTSVGSFGARPTIAPAHPSARLRPPREPGGGRGWFVDSSTQT